MGSCSTEHELDDVLDVLNDDDDGVEPSTTRKRSRRSFEYNIKWNEVPIQTLKNLTKSNTNKEAAHSNDIYALKKYLMKDLFDTYEAFKDSYAAQTKTPGMSIYESVTTQVCDKFNFSMKIEDNGLLSEDGYEPFLKSFSVGMENLGRRANEVHPGRITAVQTRGQVGVLNSAYNPTLTEEMVEEQTKLKQNLRNIFHTIRETRWNVSEVKKLMHWTYELQRKDIVNAIKKISTDQIEGDANEENADDLETGSELSRLKEEWPFLFKLRWQEDHFQRLTGFSLQISLNAYYNANLDMLMCFLCNEGTEASIKNMAIKHLWEKSGLNRDLNLIIGIMMVANYFNEDFTQVIKTAEKTTEASYVKTTVEDLEGMPTIIALDANIYRAYKYYACIDRVVILEATSSLEVVSGLIHGAFIFDAHYHEKMPHTFEFIERVMCRMGADKSQLTKKVHVTSSPVLRLVNNSRKFQERMEKYL